VRIAPYLLAVVLACLPFGTAFGATASDPRTIPLVDQSGHTFTLWDLAGKPVIITFVASRCTDACPIANAAFAQTYRQLRRDHLSARLLTITLDPVYDTPAVMAHVARHFGVPRDAWRFASGRPADVRQLMQVLGVATEPDAHGIPESHTSFIYILDRNVLLTRTLLLSTALTQEIEEALGKPSGKHAGLNAN
jgi:protein SCO1